MDVKQMFGAEHAGVVSMQRSGRKKGRRMTRRMRRGDERGAVKVVYISNPLKVTLTVSEFKERVQQLTGPDSDVGDYMYEKAHGKAPPPVEIADVPSISGECVFEDLGWMDLCFENYDCEDSLINY